MLYLGKLRKDIINALDQHIIPKLESVSVPMAYADFPFNSPSTIRTWKIASKRLSEEKASVHKWGCRIWTKEHLIIKHHPYLMFAYQGTAQKRMALSPERHQKLSSRATSSEAVGIYGVELKAPSAIYFPTGVPHNSGGRIFWEEQNRDDVSYSLLAINILPSMLLIHRSAAADGLHMGERPLQVDDKNLILLARLFAEELADANGNDQRVAQMYLTLFMLRLRKSIPAAICANTCWPEIPEVDSQISGSPETMAMFEAAIGYIQLRLHEKLNLTCIAQHLSVSPQHLNRVFVQAINMTTMRFVTSQRIRAAQEMLLKRPNWPLQEVASLVGFDNYMSFYRAFIREADCSPNEYRKITLGDSMQK